MDEFIIQELVEDVQFLNEELIESVDYGAHDTNSVSFNWEEHLVDSNGRDLLGFDSCFHEDLGVDVVIVFWYELVELTEKLEYINTLFKLLCRQMWSDNLHLELLFAQDPHVFIGLEIMRMQGRHLVEGLAEGVLDLFLNADALFE